MLWLLASLLAQAPPCETCRRPTPRIVTSQQELPPTAKTAPLEEVIDWTIEPDRPKIRTVRRNNWYFYR